MAYIETPRTDAGNSTYMPNGYGIDDFSAENTFLSPSKKEKDLVSQLRNGGGISLKTPRPRPPFGDRRNLPVAPVHGEFTPLLKSVAKKNLQRSAKCNGVPETPAFLKKGYKDSGSPALPSATPGAYSENTGSSAGATEDETPVPQMASSSAQATPLAVLPKRDGEGVLTDQGNVLTLREQENVRFIRIAKAAMLPLTCPKIINKIEKENFGLKLKIHFLQDSLNKSGPGVNQTALKENADLKVDKITMQKELARARKTLERTEREVEDYRKELQNAHDQTKRKHADQKMMAELESLRREITAKDSEIQAMRDDLDHAAGKYPEIEKLKNDVDGLQLDIREKDRLLDDREDEIEELKEQNQRDADQIAEAQEKVDMAKQRIAALEQVQRASADRSAQLHEIDDELADAQLRIQDLEREVEQAANKAENAVKEVQEARQAKEKAETDLDKVRPEQNLSCHAANLL